MADLITSGYSSVLQNTIQIKRLTTDGRKWTSNIEDKMLGKCVKVDTAGGNIYWYKN